MKTKKTLYHLVVDKSGSMRDSIDATIEGFNAQLDRIRSLALEFPEQDITLGLTLFDDRVQFLYSTEAPGKCPLLDHKSYKPGGRTALLDAIGLTIRELEKDRANIEIFQTVTVVMVVITDGHENASRLFTFEDVSIKIAALQETGQWTFSYLGATLDAADIGNKLNIDKRNSRSYDKKDMGREVFDKVSDSMRAYLLKKRMGGDLNDFLDKTDKH
jgi:hypothetical protein